MITIREFSLDSCFLGIFGTRYHLLWFGFSPETNPLHPGMILQLRWSSQFMGNHWIPTCLGGFPLNPNWFFPGTILQLIRNMKVLPLSDLRGYSQGKKFHGFLLGHVFVGCFQGCFLRWRLGGKQYSNNMKQLGLRLVKYQHKYQPLPGDHRNKGIQPVDLGVVPSCSDKQ